MAQAIQKELRWLREEIAVFDKAIRTLEADLSAPRREILLAELRSTCAFHRQKLSELEASVS